MPRPGQKEHSDNPEEIGFTLSQTNAPCGASSWLKSKEEKVDLRCQAVQIPSSEL